MNKKYIAGVILFVLAALTVWGGAWLYNAHKSEADVRGKYTFARTKDKINYLGNIKISAPESGEINIFRFQDGSWRFKEAKEYFVNEEMLSAFFNMVRRSVIISSVQADDEFLANNNLSENTGITIKIYDYDGNLLDEVVFGAIDEEKNTSWIRRNDASTYVYNISSVGGVSASAQDWLPYPLLSIKTSEIKSVTINGEKTDYREFNRRLRRFAVWRDFARTLEFLDYYGLTFKSDLADLPEYTKVRQIDVGMLNGMIYKLTVLNVDGMYWIVISMDANKVFTSGAINMAAGTYRYYSDWVFRLSDEQGNILFDEMLFE